MSKMKAGVVYAKNDIRYDDIEKPQAGPGKVCLLYTSFYKTF